MTDEIVHGTTTDCGECCDTLLKAGAGTTRHLFCMLTAMYQVGGKARPSPRAMAWKDVYAGTKFHPGTAAIRLGLAKPRAHDSQKAWEAARDSYLYHQRAVSQAIVDRKAELETEVLDRIRRLMRQISEVDYTLFYYDDEPKGAMAKLLRMIFYGIERSGVPRVEYLDHDLVGSGVRVTYKKGRHPASHEQLAEACRRCAPWALKSVAEVRKLGLGKLISSIDRKIGKVYIDRTPALKLVTLVEGWGSTTLNIADAQAAQDQYEEAVVRVVQLAAPELCDAVLAGVSWELGRSTKLAGEEKVTKRDGERLEWRGERWVVVGTANLRLVEGHAS